MIGGIVGAAIAGVVVLIALLGSWYTVDQTERGVLLRNGAVIGTAQPGLGFKVPLIDGVEKISVKTSTYTWDKMNSYSYDQQPADLKISVTLRASPDKVSDLYAKFGLLDTAVNQVVSPVVNQQVKVVFGRYTAVKAIQERGALNSSIKDAITDTLKYDPMIIIESVQLENIEFSANYLHSIEQRMLAEVEVQKLQQNAEREKVQAQITVTQAMAKANAVRAEAQANADATRLNGEASASNIKITGEAEAAAIEARASKPGPRHSAPIPISSRWCRPSGGTGFCRRRWCRVPRCRLCRSNEVRINHGRQCTILHDIVAGHRKIPHRSADSRM
jgi:regulator of protease activity HflC (stomatin/prohibitin superfamily)